jgi:hypothetical protein
LFDATRSDVECAAVRVEAAGECDVSHAFFLLSLLLQHLAQVWLHCSFIQRQDAVCRAG